MAGMGGDATEGEESVTDDSVTPKWTPGDWKFGVRRDGSIWLSLGDPAKGPHYQGDLVASVDDARLMVAAREMYEALDAMFAEFGAGETCDEECNGDNCPIFLARAAMAKARGESDCPNAPGFLPSGANFDASIAVK
jgi:hypothetical protein